MLMEDSRDFYLEQFLDLVPFADDILRRVWKRLVTNKWVWFGGSQFPLRCFAFRYARRGDVLAKKALYKRVRKNILEEHAIDGFDSLLELDREKALEELVALMDQSGVLLPDDSYRRAAYDIEEVFGKEWKDQWLRANEQKSRTAAAIKAEEGAVYRKPSGKKIRTADDLMDAFRSGDGRRAAGSFESEATGEEFEKAARNLPAPEEGLANYLTWVFVRRKWPIEPQPLFELAKNKEWKIVRKAYRVLEKLESPEVRRFALAKLNNRYQGRLACDLLIKNYRTGDEELLRQRANASRGRDEMHEILMSLRQVVDDHPEIHDEYVQYLYDTIPCSFCRYLVVKEMIKRGMVTEEVRIECLHDAAEDTRLLFGGQPA